MKKGETIGGIYYPSKSEIEAMKRRDKQIRGSYERLQNEDGEGYGHAEPEADKTPDHKTDY